MTASGGGVGDQFEPPLLSAMNPPNIGWVPPPQPTPLALGTRHTSKNTLRDEVKVPPAKLPPILMNPVSLARLLGSSVINRFGSLGPMTTGTVLSKDRATI